MKKASLNLSINAIVVLILAITMLGLGLTFMKTMFGKVTTQFGEVSSELETTIIEKLESSSSRLEFTNTQITMKRGEEKTVYFGVFNNLDGDCNFGDTDANGDGDKLPSYMFCDDALVNEETTTVYLGALGNHPTFNDFVTLSTFPGKTININQGKVFPLLINIDSNTLPDTYSCHLYIQYNQITTNAYQLSSGKTPSAVNCGSDINDVYYAKKDFFITVE